MASHDISRRSFTSFQVILLICVTLVFQSIWNRPTGWENAVQISNQMGISPERQTSSVASASTSTSTSTSTSNTMINPLSIQEGQAPNLPSIIVEDKELEASRKIYGGKGDGKHLGGFTNIDMHGISPAVWKHAVEKWTVQSVLDVGCGKGTSTSWFYTHGVRTQCVEGSHDAIEQSMVPDKSLLVEHDFSRGPWWPGQTFDAVWSVEFLEHVNLQFHYNYVSAFRKAAIIMVSSSRWGGWHHVEVHQDPWWIQKYESYGFRYSKELTDEIRRVAKSEKAGNTIFPVNGEPFGAQHIFMSMKVFINPVVAALPEHAHLFGELGCFTDYGKPNRKCGTPARPGVKKSIAAAAIETPLDPSFFPLVLTDAQDQAWYDIVKASIGDDTETPKE
mmetsp:Transcript_7182/g.14152  ORF Transcript_7182/g.14152 Transcript_7182/m.14152 type:complete len:390 (-) Transcript_7182:472-1641(-)